MIYSNCKKESSNIERIDDIEDKLVVAPIGLEFTNEEIEEAIKFQEQYFKHKIIR